MRLRPILLGSAVVFMTATGPATALPAASAARDGSTDVTVMTRNLYLGADVDVALDMLPELPSAAQFMWDQSAETDFTARVDSLAAEVATVEPDVIGLQEATTWQCRPGPFGDNTVVFDFTDQYLDALASTGREYVIAAENASFAIPPLPGMPVTSPETFQPLFGQDTATCGFATGDALLVRGDLAVQQSGTTDYEDREPLVPGTWYLDRGYAWADVAIGEQPVRFVTTHLESRWMAGEKTAASKQATQLSQDLAPTKLPLVVMGDFNTDPRDPRPVDAPNPGGQPEASEACPAQTGTDSTCNTYWTMVKAGYADAGPDPDDPLNYSWGSAANLAGPDPERVQAALEMGNPAGFTDRLDYVFVRNGVRTQTAELVGNTWPDGNDIWRCDGQAQVANSRNMSLLLFQEGKGRPVARGHCFPTDHAGLVVGLSVPVDGRTSDAPPTAHSVAKIQWWWLPSAAVIGLLAIVTLIIVGILALGRRRHRKKAARAAGEMDGSSQDPPTPPGPQDG